MKVLGATAIISAVLIAVSFSITAGIQLALLIF